MNTLIKNLLREFPIVNIYGKAGVGKTTYALQLLDYFLPIPDKYNRKHKHVIWVQGNEKFPKKRLEDMYGTSKRSVQYLQDHILLYPKFRITDYCEFCKKIQGLTRLDYKLGIPPDTSAVIIDNISYHLRGEISKHDDVGLITALLDDFFDAVMVPLSFFCGRHDISLILLHEVTYDPNIGKTVMFNHHLFSNLKCLNIQLERDPITKTRRRIRFQYLRFQKSFGYCLKSSGVQLET